MHCLLPLQAEFFAFSKKRLNQPLALLYMAVSALQCARLDWMIMYFLHCFFLKGFLNLILGSLTLGSLTLGIRGIRILGNLKRLLSSDVSRSALSGSSSWSRSSASSRSPLALNAMARIARSMVTGKEKF